MSATNPRQQVSATGTATDSVSDSASGDDRAPTTVVFDVGEVIIDETRVWSVWADILGVSPLSFAAVLGAAIVQGLDWKDALDELAPNLEWPEFVEEHERRYGGFRPVDVYEDVRPCMEELRDLGFQVVIAGNQPARRRDQLLALSLPAVAVATSEDLGADKPDRGFWDAVVRLTGADSPADILYVGDRVDNDIEPALTYGMRTCWLRRGPWGLLQDLPVTEDDEPALLPDLVLEGLGELPTLLAAWLGQPHGEKTKDQSQGS